MDPQTLVFDISSDEEFGFNNPSPVNDYDWISKLLDDPTDNSADFGCQNTNFDPIDKKIGDGNKIINDDDDDDVVVVGEVIVKPKRAKMSFSMVNNGGVDAYDDDCVVLECDPDKTPPSTSTADDEVKSCDDDDPDDLVVVGQNGQVACRDFPHSRHLCANFPFSSTSHESWCNQCHCYVCDSLAPCTYWGSGASTTDHCHATDKAGYWQIERRKFRQLKNPPLPTSNPVASLPQFPEPGQSPSQHCLRPIVVSTCGLPSPFGVPNIVRQGRTQRPSVVARNGYHPHLISRQLSQACNSDNHGNRVPQVPSRMSSRPILKRPRMPNQVVCCSPNNVTVAFSNDHQLAAKPIENGSDNLQGSSPQLVTIPFSHQSNPRTLPSLLPVQVLPGPHTPTSHFQGLSPPVGVVTDTQYINSSMHQAQTISSPLLPSNTSNALNKDSQSTQQHSIETHNISVPNFLYANSDMPTNITQISHHSPAVSQNCSSNPCNTLNSPNSIETPLDDSLPFATKDSQTAFDFDFDCWLEGNSPDGSFLDLSSQPSQTGPIDTGMLYFDFETSWQGLAHS